MVEIQKKDILQTPSIDLDRKEIIDLVKKKLEVILVYPAGFGSTDHIPYSHVVLSAGLEERGISHEVFSALRDHKKIWEKMNEKDSFQLWGIGTYYETIANMIGLAHEIRNRDPGNRFITVGGSGTNDDFTRYLLSQSEISGIDAINYGHCQPFFDFVDSIKDLEKFDIHHLKNLAQNAQMAVREKTDVPQGKFPHLKKFPLVYSTPNRETMENLSLDIPHYFNCPNSCDYCCQIKFYAPHVLKDIIQSIKEFPHTIAHVQFEGPTLEGRLVESFRKILNTIKDKQGFLPKSHIVMDSKQFQSDNILETVDILKEFNAQSIHVGINAIDENIAKMIGRRDNGKIRTEEQLQEEMQGILKFTKTNVSIEKIKLDIILTPFDTIETIGKITNFYKEILTTGRDSNKDIEMFLSPLIPYPGTKLYDRCEEYLNNFSYDKLQSSFMFDPTLWKDNLDLFGVEFLKRLSAPLMTAHYVPILNDDKFRNEYLQFLSLHMTYQFFQGVSTYEDMEILPEYIDDRGVKEIFNAMITQSVPYKKGDVEVL